MDASGAQSTFLRSTSPTKACSVPRSATLVAIKSSPTPPTKRCAPERRVTLKLRSSYLILYVPQLTQAQVQYADLVEFFYRSHDPTEENAQGPDRGTQYRSAIFAHTPEQERIAQKVTQVVQAMHFDKQAKRIVTQIQLVPESDLYVA